MILLLALIAFPCWQAALFIASSSYVYNSLLLTPPLGKHESHRTVPKLKTARAPLLLFEGKILPRISLTDRSWYLLPRTADNGFLSQ